MKAFMVITLALVTGVLMIACSLNPKTAENKGDKHKSIGSDEKYKSAPVNIYDGEFHTFALYWTPSEYIFYVDDHEFWRVDGGRKFQNCGINKNPNYIKLTVESAPWAGAIPADFTEAEMTVDYVRVYQ